MKQTKAGNLKTFPSLCSVKMGNISCLVSFNELLSLWRHVLPVLCPFFLCFPMSSPSPMTPVNNGYVYNNFSLNSTVQGIVSLEFFICWFFFQILYFSRRVFSFACVPFSVLGWLSYSQLWKINSMIDINDRYTLGRVL